MRVFVSAVSSELERARDTVAAGLRARDNFVKVQSDFRQKATGRDHPGGARRADRNDVTTALRRGSPLHGGGGLREGAQRHPTT
jgi:hypothetical protein